MNQKFKNLATHAVVITTYDAAEAIEKDVTEKWAGAEVFENPYGGFGTSLLMYENADCGFEKLCEFVDDVHTRILEWGGSADKTAIF